MRIGVHPRRAEVPLTLLLVVTTFSPSCPMNCRSALSGHYSHESMYAEGLLIFGPDTDSSHRSGHVIFDLLLMSRGSLSRIRQTTRS